MRKASFRPAVVPLLLLAALCVFAPRARGQQVSAPCEMKPPASSDFANVKALPGGKWTLTYTFDAAQYHGSALVAVRGLVGASSVKDRASKLTCAVVENRSERAVKSVRLRWVMTAREGAGEILARGEFPTVEAEIAARTKLKVELREADFANFLQPLVKDGALSGDYVLSVGVARVVFADGSEERMPDTR